MDLGISILLIVIGLIVGFGLCFIYFNIKSKSTNKTAEKIINDAKREAEKTKRDSLFETK